MSVVYLADITSEDVKVLDRERTCLMVSVSPIEEHGPHLPLSTDIIESEAMLERMSEKILESFPDWTLLVYPSIPLGAEAMDYPGSASIRPNVIRALVEDVGLSFAKHGFKYLIISNHHGAPAHNLALDTACKNIAKRSEMRAISLSGRVIVDMYLRGGLKDFYKSYGVSPSDRHMLDTDVHAGAFETSEMLAARPDLVRDVWKELKPVLIPIEKLTPSSALTEADGLGYFGAPHLASAEFGNAYFEFVINRIYPMIESFLRGEDVQALDWTSRGLLTALTQASKVRYLIQNFKNS